MAGYLTTHVLDTARGCPAEGVKITLYRLEGEIRERLAETVTNSDGRTDTPILPEDEFATGTFELVFHAAAYLQRVATSSFLGDVPIRFTMSEDKHYHVPLLLAPFGYSTYRGS